MKLMIEKEERYKFYKNTGEKPEDLYSRDRYKQIGAPPPAPPEIVDDTTEEDAPSNTAAIKQSQTSSTDEIKTDDSKSELPTTKETPLLVASKMGIVEMVRRILKKFPIAIQDTDSEEKNILLLAVEHRQTMVYNWLIGGKYPEYVFYQVDKYGNNAVHLAAKYQNLEVWRIPGKALQLQGERKWYKYVKHTLPQSDVRYNKKGQTPRRIFEETHEKLLVEGTEWLTKTAESFSVVAALIATVAFTTSATIPGGADDKGKPHLEHEPAFDVFSIASLVSLCFSVTALVFFLAILTSRCQHKDFEKDLPRKLLLGLTSLFASITAILVSFCAAHFFVLQDNFKNAAFPIYAATCIPVVFFAFNQFPLYVDLIRSYIQKLPLRSYKNTSLKFCSFAEFFLSSIRLSVDDQRLKMFSTCLTSMAIGEETRSRITTTIVIDTHHPLYLHACDTPGSSLVSFQLTGPKNYALWSRLMRIRLLGKSKMGFVDGRYTKGKFDLSLHDLWEKRNLGRITSKGEGSDSVSLFSYKGNHGEDVQPRPPGLSGKGSFGGKKDQLICDYFKWKGHTKDHCYKFHGYPSDYK
ncbi:uncharacterized protein LOC107850345 [Capsicum annuum]|uniref:uncharacterized protein LOC107850345 n=1 Tax=Capsicum annuum TaxID=4072 RepID=UPI001FB0E94A|nr:uncharacterized protein LOC107850345 [Capsicum annuum]